jgi:hypothetical protein
MKKSILIALLAFAPVFANAAPDAAVLQAAEEMAQTIGLEKQMANGFNAMLPSIDMVAKRLALGPKETEELKAIYRTWFLEDIDQADLLKQVIAIYAESYTKEELVELTRFYKSPLGQKTLSTMPEIMRKSSTAGMLAAQSKQGALQDRLKPFMEKHAPKAPAQPAPAPAPAGQ